MSQFNSSLSHSLGSLEKWFNDPYGISGLTSFGQFRVLIYGEGIARITITQKSSFESFSYSVIAAPSASPFEVHDFEQHLEIRTPVFTLVISKHPVRFFFHSLNGSPILEDDPSFGTSWNGDQVTTYKKLQEGERFVGLGEKTGHLDRRGTGYQNWNTDSFAYGTHSDPLYCSIPFYIGIHHQLVYGVFFDNSHKSFFNFGASNNRFASFSADAGEMDYYFMHGPDMRSVIRAYTYLTGRMELPPLWSIGYQQCRYSYYPDKEVLNLARTFREKDIPADTIVFDIHYMDQYKIFTWNKRDFSDPYALLQALRDMGFHVVVMCDPGIKVEENYAPYEEGIKENIFISYPDGTPYTGQVWPGWCHFPDFSNPKSREWWKRHFQEYVSLGIEGFWNDMNEIATWGNMLPENIEFFFEGARASMRRMRNLYGMLMAMSTYEATRQLLGGRRPFNLTRSGFAGVQRYAAVWTGDNVAYDEHMMLGIRLVNSMGLSGIAFAGYDVGGFVGDANAKLFARWVSIGAFSPFFRGHSMINSRDSEPWAYGEEVEQIARNYIKLRYALMPYIYSLFHDASHSGMPVQRSLAIEYPFDYKIYDIQFENQYLFGPYILVVPVESSKDFVKVYLPEGEWYFLYDGKKYSGNSELILECPIHRLPVFVKAGGILPMQPDVPNTKVKPSLLILHVYLHGYGSFTLYEDEGDTFAYRDGFFNRRQLELFPEGMRISPVEGAYVSNYVKLRVIIHGAITHLDKVLVNGVELFTTQAVNQFFPALEKFDPIREPEPPLKEDVYVFETAFSPEGMTIQWGL